MTNVDLSHIFEKKETDNTSKDIYSEMSKEELAKKAEEVENEDNEEYIKDIDDYFTEDEQVDLVERGIHLTSAKEYTLETNGKKPVWNNNVTKKFKIWLHKTHPDREKYLIDDDTNGKKMLTPLQIVIQNQKKEKEKKEFKNPFGESWRQEYTNHDVCMICHKERDLVSKYNCTCVVCDDVMSEEEYQKITSKEGKNNEVYNLLCWLYKFMSKFKFDFVPTDEEIKIIEDIKELIDNE